MTVGDRPDPDNPYERRSMRGEGGALNLWTYLLPTRPRELLGVVVLTLVFWAAAVVGFQFAVGPAVGTAFWPAAGLTLAAFVLGGVKLWPAVVMARVLAAWTVGAPQPLWALVLLGVAAAAAAAIPVLYLERTRLPREMNSLSAVLWLVLGGAVGGATLSAASGAAVLFAQGVHVAVLPQIGVNWWLGYATGVLTFAPLILAWRPAIGRRFDRRQALHFLLATATVSILAYVIFLRPELEPKRAWYIFPALVWSALAFSLRGASVGICITALIAFAGAMSGVSTIGAGEEGVGLVLLTQQFVGITSATVLILAAVADERRNKARIEASEARLRAETEALELLNRTGGAIASELDLDRAVQLVTDAGVGLCEAQFGAFFYNVTDQKGGSYMLYALSGAPRSAFERFGQPRATAVFHPTFAGEGPVRVDDITKDERYGQSAPHFGMPAGHLPVRSYLAVPVKSRTGEVIGGLFFGHAEAGRFTERAERLVVGIAAQAAIAIDNARLYQAAQLEIASRRKAEEHQRLLINELNHRVKNTLATVQSIGAQTLRTTRDLADARKAFDSRLLALSAAHNLLTTRRWSGASLSDIVRAAAAPFVGEQAERVSIAGPDVDLAPSAALAISMALHELGTNAVKYGALSVPTGRVAVEWRRTAEGAVRLRWTESGGPEVQPPTHRGFGTRLVEVALARELDGEVRTQFEREGLSCEIAFRPAGAPAAEDRTADIETDTAFARL